jgi:hypothetical protein
MTSKPRALQVQTSAAFFHNDHLLSGSQESSHGQHQDSSVFDTSGRRELGGGKHTRRLKLKVEISQ